MCSPAASASERRALARPGRDSACRRVPGASGQREAVRMHARPLLQNEDVNGRGLITTHCMHDADGAAQSGGYASCWQGRAAWFGATGAEAST